MKVIFLDFDGVITTPHSHWHIDRSKVKLVKKICNETGARVVVSSSWRPRLDQSQSKIDAWKERRLPKELGDLVIGVTPSIGGARGCEIKAWLEHHPGIEEYVILNDDDDMLEEQLFRFVETDFVCGLTNREADLCISILNHIQPYNWIRLNFILRQRWRNKCQGLPNHNIEEAMKENAEKTKDWSVSVR